MRRIGFVLVAALAFTVAGTTGAAATVGAAAHTPTMPSDFNGDGYADLAIGARGEAVAGTRHNAGSVNVLYGSSHGLTAARDQVWSQDSPGVKGRSEGDSVVGEGDAFGASLASGDLNGDGYADLAITADIERLDGNAYAGVVNVLFGSIHGLTATGDVLLTGPAIDPDIRGFGVTIAAGDVNGDGFDDLAIGTLLAVRTTEVVFGSASGLNEADALLIDRTGPLAIGDLDGDGYDDIAIGQPATDIGAVTGAGAVEVRYGSATGPSTSRIDIWSQDSPGIDDAAEPKEYFGEAVAIGDFDGDGHCDLIVPTYQESGDGGGTFNVIPGSPDGLTATGSQFWHAGIAGLPETTFGVAGAFGVGDLDGDGDDDLAIGGVGMPGADYSGARRAILVLNGGAGGLSVGGARLWWQDTPGVPGRDEVDDYFGSELKTADFDGSGAADLAVGVFRENFAGLSNAGAVVVLYGTDTGLGTARAQSWTQNSPGVRGTSEKRDFFGWGL